ncbi:hypothetical protein CEN44_21825 [Fischerella muscicola CCMEE 5323]|uniref:Uncharacterized protein n=1 Tax=Fischerella muscicola CCMEE 5323 TaxID=2019572 RepID=A0A2N6JY05_FISMU|nr:hypothetical protein [Fischerella muscicola]PLZ85657.1 hypothetical protein CEN44_21825 [Fischerella muscicola CCMEE 5323]
MEKLTKTHCLIPFHHKSDTLGKLKDKEDKEDKRENLYLYQQFCQMLSELAGADNSDNKNDTPKLKIAQLKKTQVSLLKVDSS